MTQSRFSFQSLISQLLFEISRFRLNSWAQDVEIALKIHDDLALSF